MSREPAGAPPPGVAERLARLSALYVPETDAEARARLDRERPRAREPFAVVVAWRLDELRALSALADYLHQARVPADPGPAEPPGPPRSGREPR
jgi:hypothetical protein